MGLVENYAWLICPDCGKKLEVFGKSHVEELARQYNLPILARLPIDAEIARLMDNGEAEEVDATLLDTAVELLENQ